MSNEAQAARAQIEAALADGFLAENHRFKLSFTERGDTPTLCAFSEKLDGEWVALLPASNDSHTRFLANIRILLDDHDAQLRAANERIQPRTPAEPKCQNCDGKGGFITAEWVDPVSGPETEGERCEECEGTGLAEQPRTLDAPVSEPNLLSISEQRAVLADLMGLECLINRHDCWETEADARDMAECVPGHSKRRKELIEMGRAIIAADPDCWYDEQKAPFKLRYGESAAPTPRKGEHHEKRIVAAGA